MGTFCLPPALISIRLSFFSLCAELSFRAIHEFAERFPGQGHALFFSSEAKSRDGRVFLRKNFLPVLSAHARGAWDVPKCFSLLHVQNTPRGVSATPHRLVFDPQKSLG